MKKLNLKPKILLSTLWIFVMFNYLYCDILGLMDVNILNQILRSTVDGLKMDEQLLLYAAILMEIPIVMILLSRILDYKYNRIINIIAASIKTVAMIMTLFVGTTTLYYAFFAVIEIACTTYIIIYSIRWKEQNL